MTAKPIDFAWDGEAMFPERRFVPLCNRVFVVGERYRMVRVEDRSAVSHRHYFASITETWKNLPEQLAKRFNSSEALRKHALIQCGYAESRTVRCKTPDEADRMAAILATFISPHDPYVEIVINGLDVTAYTAESQAYGAQKPKEFQQCKEMVLEFIAHMVGVAKEQLEEEARRAMPHHEGERVRNPLVAG